MHPAPCPTVGTGTAPAPHKHQAALQHHQPLHSPAWEDGRPCSLGPCPCSLTLLGSSTGLGPCAQLPASSTSVSRASSCDVGRYQHPLSPALRLLPAQCAQTPRSRAQAGCDSAGLGDLQPRQDPGPRASPASTTAAAAHLHCPSQFAPCRHSERASSQGRCRTGASCSQPSRTHFCDSAPVTATRPLHIPPLDPCHHHVTAMLPQSRPWQAPAAARGARRHAAR